MIITIMANQTNHYIVIWQRCRTSERRFFNFTLFSSIKWCMDKMKNTQISKANFIFFALMLLGILLRIFNFNQVPGGMNQDEAFILHESWSLLNYGVDTWGYSFPVYFVSIGGGQSVLLSYLSVPLVAIFGLNVIAIRIPVLILFIISMYYFYKIFKELCDERAGLIALFIIATNPFHIMSSRWGLDCFLLLPMMIISSYYPIMAYKYNSKYLIVAAVFLGLCLYSYSLCWVLIPFYLLVYAYLYFKNAHGKIDKNLIIGLVVLFIMALPLLLFLLVNYNVIPEIRSFMSIPHLTNMRVGEISLTNIPDNFFNLLSVIFTYRLLHVATPFGSFNIIGSLLIIVGIVVFVYKAIKNNSIESRLFLIIFLITVFYALLILNLVEYKIIYLYPFLYFFETVGLIFLVGNYKLLGKALLIIILGFTLLFELEYNCAWRVIGNIPNVFDADLKEALNVASETEAEDIYIVSYRGNDQSVMYSKLLVYEEIPYYEFVKDSQLRDYTAVYTSMDHIVHDGKTYHYVYYEDVPEDDEAAYIFYKGNEELPEWTKGLEKAEFKWICVVY